MSTVVTDAKEVSAQLATHLLDIEVDVDDVGEGPHDWCVSGLFNAGQRCPTCHGYSLVQGGVPIHCPWCGSKLDRDSAKTYPLTQEALNEIPNMTPGEAAEAAHSASLVLQREHVDGFAERENAHLAAFLELREILSDPENLEAAKRGAASGRERADRLVAATEGGAA